MHFRFCRLIADCHIVGSTPCNHRELNSVLHATVVRPIILEDTYEERGSCTWFGNISGTDDFYLDKKLNLYIQSQILFWLFINTSVDWCTKTPAPVLSISSQSNLLCSRRLMGKKRQLENWVLKHSSALYPYRSNFTEVLLALAYLSWQYSSQGPCGFYSCLSTHALFNDSH